jgi:hypothetical protein
MLAKPYGLLGLMVRAGAHHDTWVKSIRMAWSFRAAPRVGLRWTESLGYLHWRRRFTLLDLSTASGSNLTDTRRLRG